MTQDISSNYVDITYTVDEIHAMSKLLYKVQKDSKLLVEKIEANIGDEVLLNEVLMIGDGEKINFGSPKIEDAAVLAEVIKQTRGPKITIIYKRRRKNSRRKQGHKQDLTLLKVKDIATSGG